MSRNKNYLDVSAVAYPPKLHKPRSLLVLTLEQKNEVATATNDACLRLYELYIYKQNWKHFNPTDYKRLGEALEWTESKTKKCKDMLTKAGFLFIKKDTLPDSTKIYRIFLGKEVVNLYKETKQLPSEREGFTYDKDGLNEFLAGSE